MASFHLFQRVRIVAAHPSMSHWIGVETCIVRMGGPFGYPYNTATILLAITDVSGWHIGCRPQHIEPLKYEPDAEDLATRENAPTFDCPVPVAA